MKIWSFFLRGAAIVAGGLLLVRCALWAMTLAPGLWLKSHGGDCPWREVLSWYSDTKELDFLETQMRSALRIEAAEGAFASIAGGRRPFWVSTGDFGAEGERQQLAYLLADHDWMAWHDPRQTVQAGDVVIDCGAHVGVFTSKALELGAAKVIAIEPRPDLVECLRRGFARELRERRVEIAPVAVWSRPGRMTLWVKGPNSGMASLLPDEQQDQRRSIEVPVTTIDDLVRDLMLPRVDYIKMDIEGAEREALRGSRETLRRFRPRLMLDAYHRPGDPTALPALARESGTPYRVTCGPCVPDRKRLVPHVIFLSP